ncbi:MAG: hypothetical protein ACFBSG_19335 [Leptolyngbyaceae cyanobacterium]
MSQSWSSLPNSLSQEGSYSSEAVQVILARALELRDEERYSLTQLQEMAGDLEISTEALGQAIAEWRSSLVSDTTVPSTDTTPTMPSPSRRQKWQGYLLASVLMVGIDIATAGMVTWSIFPVLGWGLGLGRGCRDRAVDNSSPAN